MRCSLGKHVSVGKNKTLLSWVILPFDVYAITAEVVTDNGKVVKETETAVGYSDTGTRRICEIVEAVLFEETSHGK